MEITEQENGKGAVGKTRHLYISRKDTLVNDLRNSTAEGLLSAALALAALGLTGFSVYYSYRQAGEAGYELGIMAFFGFLLAVLAVLFGIIGKRNHKKIRHEMEKRGILVGSLIVAALIAFFVRGAILCGT